jgi:mannosyltransferase OCH1-like enzyme
MIPKIIHYCWLSDDPIPDNYQKCRNTWNEKAQGYEFILWDTHRFDVNTLMWTKQAFEQKRYAFVADYIRFYAVYHYGGIYLDMDIEAVKSFDPLLNQDLMLAYESHVNNNLEAGCFGAEKHNPFIQSCMSYYEGRDFKPVLAPLVMRRAMDAMKIKPAIYSRDYFTAKNIMTGVVERTENTFAIHHFASGYVPKTHKMYRAVKQKIRKEFGEKSITTKIITTLISIIFFPIVRLSGLIFNIRVKNK